MSTRLLHSCGLAAPVPFDHKPSCIQWSSPPVNRCSNYSSAACRFISNDPSVVLRTSWWPFIGIFRFSAKLHAAVVFREAAPQLDRCQKSASALWILLSRVPSLGLACFLAHFLLRHLFQRRAVRLSEQPHGVHCSHAFMIRARRQSRHVYSSSKSG